MKVCTKCGETKPPSEFYAAPNNRDGLTGACKLCKRAAQRAYVGANREAVNEAKREWRARNADAVRSKQRDWYAANSERDRARSKQWKQANPDARARHNSKDRARRYGADHEPYSRTAVLGRWGSRCCYCDASATTLDHVVPLGFGGHDVERNVVPACQPCNSSKGRKTLAEWALAW
ncbi:HNH endonuclease [Streptomyces lasiicapitis]|uniref:HNH endonuclease n=1 Tax=Streptomyces lasiicapitis TaxID=1923961 RepID=UPI00331C76ED